MVQCSTIITSYKRRKRTFKILFNNLHYKTKTNKWFYHVRQRQNHCFTLRNHNKLVYDVVLLFCNIINKKLNVYISTQKDIHKYYMVYNYKVTDDYCLNSNHILHKSLML